MKIVGYPNPSGSAWWRLHHPFKYLERLGHEVIVSDVGITESLTQWGDIHVLQSCVDKDGIALLYTYQQEHGKRLVVDSDDAPIVADDSPFKLEHEVSNAPAVIQATMEVADLVTCTTPYLAKKLSTYNKNVKVLPNMLDLEVWEKPVLPKLNGRIRIGWAGSITHLEDLKLVVEPLKRIKALYTEVDLVFCGETRIREMFGDTPVEVVLGVPFTSWPTRLAGLRLNIGLAPLQDTEFNRCKSNIKWLEYSINKIPAVYSPTVYQQNGVKFDAEFGLIARTEEEWFRCLDNLVRSQPLRDDLGDHAYSWVRRKYNLAGGDTPGAKLWEQAYTSLFQS